MTKVRMMILAGIDTIQMKYGNQPTLHGKSSFFVFMNLI